jgi:cell division protein ZapA
MNATTDTLTLKAKVGTQDYSLRVTRASEEEVKLAIEMVTERFNAISASGKVLNPERIAVMVALNLAAELNKLKTAPAPGFDFPNTDIASLRQHIGQVLRT